MKRSNWWYILPIFFGFIGGVIGFFAIKGNDKNKAVNLLLVGVGVTVLMVLLNIGVIFGVSFPIWQPLQNDVITIPDCNVEAC